ATQRAGWSANGSGHSFPAKSETWYLMIRGCAMHCAGSFSSADRSARPGEIIPFGTYPHTVDGTDRTPIQWRVLQNSGGELFLLSEHILDCKRYHSGFTAITWHDCDLRQWLNDAFYQAAFTDAEKAVIKTTHCT